MAAYFTAYELKGRDLKINKVDVVDIDLRGNRVSGDSWFTIFSPRIQNYTIGVEPMGPETSGATNPVWVPDSAKTTLPDTVVSWQGKAKNNRQSLFRRTYSYHASIEPDASGRQPFADAMDQVPIQVWSTKTFVGNWSSRMDPAKPLFVSTLRISEADPSQITGSITSNLPIETLTDAHLLYRGPRDGLAARQLRVAERFVSTSAQAQSAMSWLQTASNQRDMVSGRSGGRYSYQEDDPNFRLWPVLFHELLTGQHARMYNASMRDLDQSWRIGDRSDL